MRIDIEVSEKNEGTASPYWLILDPKQNMNRSLYTLANQITGPFFSREEEAESICESANHGVERHEEMRPASDYVDRLLNDSWKEYLFFKPISWLMPKKFSPSNVLRIVNRC